MQHKIHVLVSIVAVLALALGACSPQATPDVAAISTVAAQTVEARFTAQAAAFTATPLPATETPVPPAPTKPAAAKPSPVPPTADGNGKACYAMTFVTDVTIPDGMIVAPGSRFTKTWRVRNDGNCVWDQTYALVLSKGDAMSSVTSFPLTRVVNPGDTADISIEFTAPTTEGVYTGFWHILTPYGGTMGVGSYNQSISVQVTVSARPERDFGVVSVVYGMTRRPATGCSAQGAEYEFSATITVNGPGEMSYRWDRRPTDGTYVGGKLKFSAAGSQTVSWIWKMTSDHKQGIDRYAWLTPIIGGKDDASFSNGVVFNYSCN